MWLSWIDDCLCVGEAEAVVKAKDDMLKRFDCDDIGEVNEYLGCKIDINKEEGSLKMTQPVLLQSYSDEFNLPETGRVSNIPAVAGSVLSPEVPKGRRLMMEHIQNIDLPLENCYIIVDGQDRKFGTLSES